MEQEADADTGSQVTDESADFFRDFEVEANEPGAVSHRLTRRAFLIGLGLVYFLAFLSLWTQIHGLVGSEGILPAGEFIEKVEAHAEKEQLGWRVFLRYPTLCLLSASDAFLDLLCAAGIGLSLLLVAGVAPIPVLILLWLVYLSLATVCQVFFQFQWDALLLETGFLALFFAPLGFRPTLSGQLEPSKLSLWLLRLLLLKFMFASGVVKLTYGDETWWNLTALNVHYETQPLPTWIGWFIHQLPEWFHKSSVVVTYVIEIVLPFLVFLPLVFRVLPFVGIVSLMGVIGLSGNYGFFNLLTIVLCLVLLDDRAFPRRVREHFPDAGVWGSHALLPLRVWGHRVLAGAVAIFFVYTSAIDMVRDTFNQRDAELPAAVLQTHYRVKSAFRSINSYGLFRVMTTSRPELVIEGSLDGKEWQAYEFRWKPGDVKHAPGFVEPHMPRLDWQMWFAALSVERAGPRGVPSWLALFMKRLVTPSQPTLKLLEHNPFPEQPPKYLRLLLYDYRFTDSETRAKTGAWWRRELKGEILKLPRERLMLLEG